MSAIVTARVPRLRVPAHFCLDAEHISTIREHRICAPADVRAARLASTDPECNGLYEVLPIESFNLSATLTLSI